jgi:integrase
MVSFQLVGNYQVMAVVVCLIAERSLMSRKKSSVPVMRLHKASRRAMVYVNEQFIYLGKWESPEAENEYRRILAEIWAGSPGTPTAEVTVADLVARFLIHAKDFYRKPSGRPTGSWERYILAVRPLVKFYGETLVSNFGPLALKAVREDMVRSGLARRTVNTRITLIKTMFRWGVENELVPVTVHQALLAVRILEEGKTTAPDYPPVPAVDKEIVLKTIKHCHKIVADMILVQMFGAMRPGEVCLMRPCDIDCSGDIWVYTPFEHKTQHHKGHYRAIPIIPESQAILMPYLLELEDTPESYIFSPKNAMQLIHIERGRKRKSKITPSQILRKIDRKKNEAKKRVPGDCYNNRSYSHALRAAIELAGVPHWSPNQLRHTMATEVDKILGIEATSVLLGHNNTEITKIYLDPEAKRKAHAEAVKEIARKIGKG